MEIDFEVMKAHLNSGRAWQMALLAFSAAEKLEAREIPVENALSEILSLLAFDFAWIAKMEYEHEERAKESQA